MNFICVYQVWSKLIEKYPSKIQYGRHESFFCHFNIRPRWFPAHHRDRLVPYNFNWLKANPHMKPCNCILDLEWLSFHGRNFYFIFCPCLSNKRDLVNPIYFRFVNKFNLKTEEFYLFFKSYIKKEDWRVLPPRRVRSPIV